MDEIIVIRAEDPDGSLFYTLLALACMERGSLSRLTRQRGRCVLCWV